MSPPPSRDVRALSPATLTAPWSDLIPLWRVAAVVAVLTALVGAQLTVRLWHAESTAEIRAIKHREALASTAMEQLELELAVRRGVPYLQRAAGLYGLVPAGERASTGPARSRQ